MQIVLELTIDTEGNEAQLWTGTADGQHIAPGSMSSETRAALAAYLDMVTALLDNPAKDDEFSSYTLDRATVPADYTHEQQHDGQYKKENTDKWKRPR